MLWNLLGLRRQTKHVCKSLPCARGFRATLEELDGRWTPAKFHWDPAYFHLDPPFTGYRDSNWNNVSNWDVWDATFGRWDSATRAPGLTTATADDEVEFDGDGNRPCDVNAPVSLRSVKVWNGYTEQITLAQPLAVTQAAGATPAGLLLLDSSSATISGPTGGTGVLKIVANSNFDWKGGKLNSLHVSVGTPFVASANMNVVGSTAAGPGGGPAPPTLLMSDVDIDIDYGQLRWYSGSVAVLGSPVSTLNIKSRPTGSFSIQANDTWGSVGRGPIPDNFTVNNAGYIVSAASATLNGNFLNTCDIVIRSNALTFGGKAEQTGGTFEIAAGATAKLDGTDHILNIYNGLIGGSGTVDGNLTLGYDPARGVAPATTPVLRTGPDDENMGDLTVTKSFQAFSSASTVKVKVGDGGATSKLVVAFNAALNGTLEIAWVNANPPKRAEHILVSIGGSPSGAFANFIEDGRVANQGVTFKTTYLGGDGNDVSLKPLFNISGRVWMDLNRDGIQDDGEGTPNDYWGYDYDTFGDFVVKLINLDTGTQSAWSEVSVDDTYSFRDLLPGQYQVVMYNPGFFDELYWQVGKFSPTGATSDPTKDCDFTDIGFNPVLLGDNGYSADDYPVWTYGISDEITIVAGQDISSIDAGVWIYDPHGYYAGAPGIFDDIPN